MHVQRSRGLVLAGLGECFDQRLAGKRGAIFPHQELQQGELGGGQAHLLSSDGKTMGREVHDHPISREGTVERIPVMAKAVGDPL